MKNKAVLKSSMLIVIPVLALAATRFVFGSEIAVMDQGIGCDYASGEPIILPAAGLSTNLFGHGVNPIKNRQHTVQAAAFDSSGALSHALSARPAAFPAYLKGYPYVSFLQDVRHYTNYSCTVTVDCPSTFYLLVDNRVNDFNEFSSLNDPSFGPPDTEWISKDGWNRVNTGISPSIGGTNRGDYICIHEGGVGAISQFYSVYSKTLTNGGSLTFRTQFEGNMYCVVVATNVVSCPTNACSIPATVTPRQNESR
jgi:hypothetical protein